MTDKNIFDRLRAAEVLYGGAADCPEVSKVLVECADACFEINAVRPSEKERRERLFRRLLGSVGEHFVIHSPFRCDFGFNIHVGENFIGNFNLSILDEAEVRIGDNVMIGPNCSLITITHDLDPEERGKGLMQAKPISIGDNAWIAANVVVLPGVNIGANAIVGAGSVVTRDVPPDVIVAGNPARIIKVGVKRNEDDKYKTTGHL